NSVTFTGLAAGIYHVTYTDANGCILPVQLVAIVPTGTSGITGTATAQPTACSGSNNGSITVTPTNGSAPYTFTLNPGNISQTSPTFTGLAVGTYTISIKDAFNCTSPTPVSATVTAGTGVVGTTT